MTRIANNGQGGGNTTLEVCAVAQGNSPVPERPDTRTGHFRACSPAPALLILALLLLTSCAANCRQVAIKDARALAPEAETRITCYRTAPRPSLTYAFWPYHCQAQQMQPAGQGWAWVQDGKVTGEMDFRPSKTDAGYEYYTPEQLEQLIKDHPRHDWWKIALILLLI